MFDAVVVPGGNTLLSALYLTLSLYHQPAFSLNYYYLAPYLFNNIPKRINSPTLLYYYNGNRFINFPILHGAAGDECVGDVPCW